MRRAMFGLFVILLFDVWLRAHTFGPTLHTRYGIDLWPVTGAESEPLDCDESAYAYIGRRIVHGSVMYRDLTENKPPGGYWLYSLAVLIGGANEFTIRVMPIPMVLGTIVLVWWLGLRLRGPGAACLAGLIYAIASTDPYVFGNGANLEHAINFFSIASLAFLVGAWESPNRSGLFVSGLCLGAACLVKQVAILHLPIFAIALLFRWGLFRDRLLDVLDLLVGFALVWIVAVSVLVIQGAGLSAFEDIVKYGAALAMDTPPEPHAPPAWMRWLTGNADPNGGLPPPFGHTNYLVWWGHGSWPLWLAAIPSLIALGFGPRTTAPRRLVVAWTFSACVQVVLPRLYWPHYYLLPLPGLAVAIAVHLADCAVLSREKGIRRLCGLWALVLFTAVAATGWIQVRDYLLVKPAELTEKYKGGKQWVSLRALGRELAQRSKIWASPHLYVWGWQSPLFIYSGLDGVSRHFFADPLLKAFAGSNHPLIHPRTERIMSDLRAHPPELIFSGDPPFPELKRFLEEGYLRSHLVASAPDGRGLWVERTKYKQFETYEANEKPRESSPRGSGESRAGGPRRLDPPYPIRSPRAPYLVGWVELARPTGGGRRRSDADR